MHESGMRGEATFLFEEGLGREGQEAALKVRFGGGAEVVYDVTNAEGDSWVGGGVGGEKTNPIPPPVYV